MIESAAWYIRQIENHCKLTEDHRAGQAFKLLPWQKKALRKIKTSRIFWLEIPRKNGKTAYLSAIALAHMIEGYKNNSNPEVIIAASTREQAGLLYNYIYNQILLSPVLRKIMEGYRKEIRLKGMAGRIKTITSDGLKNHGLNPSLILCDELHAWTETGGPVLWEALTTAMGARDSRLVSITTAGTQYSFAHTLHEYARGVMTGQIEDKYWDAMIFKADEDADPLDPKVYKSKKVNPSIDVAVKGDFLDMIATKAKNDQSVLLSFRKLHLNQWSGTSAPFIDINEWNALAVDSPPESLENWQCFLGVDLANVSDFNAFAVIWKSGAKYYTEQHYLITEEMLNNREKKLPSLIHDWIKKGLVRVVPGKVVTNEDRLALIDELINQHDIERILFDPWNAHEVTAKLEETYGEDFCLGVRQSVAHISEPMKLLYNLAKTGNIHHNGNTVTSWMFGNVMLERDKNENWHYNKAKVSEKIDGVAAIVTGLAGFVHDEDNQDELAREDIFFL